MDIRITKLDGKKKGFNGDISYDESVVVAKYVPADNEDKWREIIMPWRAIQEVEVRP